MFPDRIALLSVTALAKKVGGSALPNAPVFDDSSDRLPIGRRLTALRKRLAKVVWPGELNVKVPAPAPLFPQDTSVAGC